MISRFSDKNLLGAMHAALRHVAQTLDIPLTVVLWDGSVAPLSQGAAPETKITIKSPGAVAALLKHPTPEALARQYATGNIAFEGDMIASGHAMRAKVRRKDVRKLDKRLLLKLLWPFLFVRGAKALPRHGYGENSTAHANEKNQEYIQFHYDVGNDFYKLFLDPQMQYSCAYFTDISNALEKAQADKLEMICRKLRLKAGERLLDIGCGWGGLICYAATHYGVRAHGITLSQEQHDFVREKIRALGLENLISVEIRDYLSLEGQYDKIASVGMFEHVGIDHFPAYFRKINTLLPDGGIFLNHAIACRGKAGNKKKLSPEKRMLLKYIFPGGELAPVGYTVSSMEAGGFEIHDVENWRAHYELTCKHWYQRLCANEERAIALVGPERYYLWAAYLGGVSLAFAAGSSLIYQVVGTKRGKVKGPSGMPLTRADLYRS